MHSPFLPRATDPRRPRERQITTHTAPPRIEPIAEADWPAWAKIAAWKAREQQDLGLGDTIVRLIGNTRSAAFKKWFQETFGQSCGCTERQRWLNARFPYQITPN